MIKKQEWKKWELLWITYFFGSFCWTSTYQQSEVLLKLTSPRLAECGELSSGLSAPGLRLFDLRPSTEEAQLCLLVPEHQHVHSQATAGRKDKEGGGIGVPRKKATTKLFYFLGAKKTSSSELKVLVVYLKKVELHQFSLRVQLPVVYLEKLEGVEPPARKPSTRRSCCSSMLQLPVVSRKPRYAKIDKPLETKQTKKQQHTQTNTQTHTKTSKKNKQTKTNKQTNTNKQKQTKTNKQTNKQTNKRNKRNKRHKRNQRNKKTERNHWQLRCFCSSGPLGSKASLFARSLACKPMPSARQARTASWASWGWTWPST